ncbi:hypothetical protein ECZU08_23500 [Escherichia coli]|nr:hypothetical protein ECZU08_23500 [Escherichia coli]
MAYSKIRQPKLSDVIEQQLEFLILEGTLRPGEKLPPERELAKQFDVSRPSLREAIQRLEAKGLLLRRRVAALCPEQPLAKLQRSAGGAALRPS